jgi:transposase
MKHSAPGAWASGCAPSWLTPTDYSRACVKASRVLVETCSEAFGVADAAVRAGHEVRVVPATLVRSLAVDARGLKNDRRDARVLSEVSCRIDLPSVHVPSLQSRERKTLCRMREALVSARAKMVAARSCGAWSAPEPSACRQGVSASARVGGEE